MTHRKRGRPTKPAKPGTKVSLGLKVTAAIKTLLEAAANQSGRTQSQEAEMRIERTFRDDEVLIELRSMRILLDSRRRSGGDWRC